jgi:phosphonopyruvate decarboxylase
MVKKYNGNLLPEDLYKILIKNEISYFCGVPDSLLSPIGFYLEDNSKNTHDIAANEGNAIALAIGYYLATSKLPLVYMQNSGLGNATNPILSLASPLILGIPMILLIGWRGQPGKQDEPQHQAQGLMTISMLDAIGIEHVILSSNPEEASLQIGATAHKAFNTMRPYAIIVEANTIESYKKDTEKKSNSYHLSREKAIEYIADSLGESDIVVATTGKTSRELYEYRETKAQSHNDLLIIGGMGHASSIALGVAQQKPHKKVYCVDGDGSVLMHMGSLATIGSKHLNNFYHTVINNGSHESVGGQPTVGFTIDMPKVAKACGYAHVYSVHEARSVKNILKRIKNLDGPVFIEIRVNMKSRPNLTRPAITPSQNKQTFMSFIDKP